MIDAEGWLSGARKVPSPNFNERPQGCEVELLVIHNISLPPGKFGGGYIEQLFTNTLNPDGHEYFSSVAHLQVSSHLLIDREGALTQFVPFTARAWHAGASCYGGRDNCNDFSVGVELEGADDIPYSEPQYTRLAEVTRVLMSHFPGITRERIVGHSDIAPGRKTDPGSAFEWQKYRQKLGEG